MNYISYVMFPHFLIFQISPLTMRTVEGKLGVFFIQLFKERGNNAGVPNKGYIWVWG